MTAAGLGAIVGLILALTGAGGGIIATPLLVFALGLDVAHAAPISLFAVGSSALIGTVIGLRAGIVRYRAAMLMAASGAMTTPIGVWLAHRLPPQPMLLLFALVLLYVAYNTFRRTRHEPSDCGEAPDTPCSLNAQTGRFRWTATCVRTMLATGALTGLLSGLLGVGGGFVIVPALRRTTDLPANSIVATSLMVIALVSTSAVLSTALAGHLRYALALPFAAGSMLAMLAGRRLAAHLAGARLQQAFAALCGLVALGMIVDALR